MKFVAFLRGINVGGVKLSAAEQKKLFLDAGLAEVSTVLATGNVIFESPSAEPDLSFLPVASFVRTDESVRQLIEQNPFPKAADKHIYVLICQSEFLSVAKNQPVSPDESVKIIDDMVYWQVPVGQMLKTPFGKLLGKKIYQNLFTSRNLNTIEKIIKKL